jgi:methionyl-tRNA formyltransferase
MTTTNDIRVALLCSSRFALPVMQELVFFKQLVFVAVPRNRREIVENVQALLKDTGIPILELDKRSFARELTRAMKQHQVNLGLMMTFGYLIPPEVYNYPEKGFLNVHPGPLPAYRGADPVFMQIFNREEFAGVSIHKLDDTYDTGPLVLTQMIKREQTDTYGILFSKLAQLAAGMVRTLLKLVVYDLKLPSKPQEGKAVFYARQGPKEITIHWQEMEADAIIALINACNPWNKGAVTKFNNRILRIVDAEKYPNNKKEVAAGPGTVNVLEGKTILVSTINNQAIKLNIVYLDEGFLNASRLIEIGLKTGSCFE